MGIFLLLILLGLVIGSFVGVVTYRIPRNLGFVKGRSFCDLCKKDLSWYDNIPIISFLYYHGRSRCCNKKISIRYPLIELFFALGAVVLYYLFSFSLFPITYFLFTILLAILVIDLENQIIPDELSWALMLYAICFMPYGLELTPYSFLFSGFFFSSLLLTLYLSTSGHGMGLGDVKLAIPLGFILGFEKGIYWLMISFILGGIIATVLLLFKIAHLKTKIAFGPFLIVAFWIVLIYEKIYPF
ncbi:MAG: prepilin peptidase [Patescibacteria group bacterium]